MQHGSIWLANLSDAERRELQPEVPLPLPSNPDVLIVGGGLIGLSIAYCLTRLGAGSICVVDAAPLSSGASAANGGGVIVGQMGSYYPQPFRRLGLASLKLFHDWIDEGWADLHWVVNGSLAVSPEELPCPMPEYAELERQLGRNAEYVSGDRLRSLEPELSGRITEGVFYPEDAQIDPLRMALSLVRELPRRGVTLATGVRVERLATVARRVARVETSAGTFEPGSVVITTGWAGGRLASQLGINLPLQPAKGQMIATRPVELKVRTNVSGGLLIRQLVGGEIIAGGTIEFVGEDHEPAEATSRRIFELACDRIPALRNVEFVRAWAGLRPHTPDEMPVVDRLPSVDNAWLAAGHFTKGVMLAPITGRLVAEWIVDGRPSIDIGYLNASRFGSRQAD